MDDAQLQADINHEPPRGIMDQNPADQGGGMAHVVSPEGIEEAHSAELARIATEQPEEVVQPLIGYLMSIVNENRDHRESQGIEDALLDCERRAQGIYSPTKAAQIREYGGSTAYMNITGVKVRAADAWMSEILTTDREQLWRLEPTPIVDIPTPMAEEMAKMAVTRIKQLKAEAEQNGQEMQLTPELIYELSSTVRDQVLAERKQAATDAAARMEQVIHDQMVDMEFNDYLTGAITDVCKSKAAILKGPIAVRMKVRQWTPQIDGSAKLTVEHVIRPQIFRVDPIDYFPSPLAGNSNQGNIVERVHYEHGDLADLRDAPNYSKPAINKILENFENTQPTVRRSTESDDMRNIDRDSTGVSRTSTTGWEVWAVAKGQDLLDMGFEKERDGETALDPLGAYDVNAIMIDSELIFLDHNPCEMGTRPYSHEGWAPVTGGFWSQSIAELMSDIQDICNGSIRALSNNMAFASGPQSVINDIERLPDGEELTPPQPLKMWQFTNRGKMAGKPLDFFQPNSNAAELLAVYDRFAKLADDYTGIPAYAYGNDRVAGAGRTASGLSMLMSSAARGVKKVVLRLDAHILRKVVKDLYYYNLRFHEDPLLRKGADVEVRATGAIQIMIKEQMSQRRMEFLQATMNDIDFKIVGEENRAKLLREIGVSLDLDFDVVKTTKQIADMIASDAQAAQEQRQLELAELERQAQKEEAEIALEAAKAATERAKVEGNLENDRAKIEQAGVETGAVE